MIGILLSSAVIDNEIHLFVFLSVHVTLNLSFGEFHWQSFGPNIEWQHAAEIIKSVEFRLDAESN